MTMAGTALAPTPAPAASTPAPRKRSLGRALSQRRTRFGLLNATPVVVYLLVLFVYPIFSTLMLSLKGDDGGFTLHWYTDAFQGANLEILLTTLRISAETSLLALVVGLVLASAISRLKPLWAAWRCSWWSSRTSSARWCAPTAGSSCSVTTVW